MDEKEILRARLLATPRIVFRSVSFAVALAVFITIRVLWTYQQAGKPLGRGLGFAALMSFGIVSSALSVLSKNKLGYVLVLIFALLPLLGSLGLSLHALTLLITGNSANDRIGLVTSFIGLLQFVTILALLTSLLHRQTRDWVWKNLTVVPA